MGDNMRRDHWQRVYGQKPADQVSWFQEHAEPSLSRMAALGLGLTACLIDVGGGASVLVDEWLARGYQSLTVLDISAAALALARQRLGARSAMVEWRVGDITQVVLPKAHYDLWHDRAVFHFLTEPEQQRAYVDQLQESLKPGGWLLMSTFSLSGPLRCSDLPVVRYDGELLQQVLGDRFRLHDQVTQDHVTPRATHQSFLHATFQFQGAAELSSAKI